MDGTKNITDLYKFHFETPGHETDYVSLDETAQSLAALKQKVNIEELRRYFYGKFSEQVPFFLSLVAPYFDECAQILLDFSCDPNRTFQFYAGSGLLQSANYSNKGKEILTRLVDSYLQGDTDEIYPSMFRELLDEKKVAQMNNIDDLRNKIQAMKV
jgi:hypothetical protein